MNIVERVFRKKLKKLLEEYKNSREYILDEISFFHHGHYWGLKTTSSFKTKFEAYIAKYGPIKKLETKGNRGVIQLFHTTVLVKLLHVSRIKKVYVLISQVRPTVQRKKSLSVR